MSLSEPDLITRRALRKLGSAATALIAMAGVMVLLWVIPQQILLHVVSRSGPGYIAGAHGLLSVLFCVICILWAAYLIMSFVLGPLATLMTKMSLISALCLASPIWLSSAMGGAILALPLALAMIPDWPTPVTALIFLALVACWSWLAKCREEIVDETLSRFLAPDGAPP